MTIENHDQMLKRLKEHYSKSKSADLYAFLHLVDQLGKSRAKTMYGTYGYSRRAKALRAVGIHLPVASVDGLPKGFRLEIPSPWVVNSTDEPSIWEVEAEGDQPAPPAGDKRSQSAES